MRSRLAHHIGSRHIWRRDSRTIGISNHHTSLLPVDLRQALLLL
jgi:hypothetical protein